MCFHRPNLVATFAVASPSSRAVDCNWSKLQLQTVQWQLHILLLVEIIGQTGFSIEPIKNQAGLAFCDEVQLSSRLYSDHHWNAIFYLSDNNFSSSWQSDIIFSFLSPPKLLFLSWPYFLNLQQSISIRCNSLHWNEAGKMHLSFCNRDWLEWNPSVAATKSAWMQQLLAITVGSNCLTNTSISRVMSTETVVDQTYLSFWLSTRWCGTKAVQLSWESNVLALY